MRKTIVCILSLALIASVAGRLAADPASKQEIIRYSAPEMFTYDELVEMSHEELSEEMAARIETFMSTPFVSNEAYYNGVRPRGIEVQGLGKGLRLVAWNIERGIYLDDIKLLFTDKDEYLENVEEGRHLSKTIKEKLAENPLF